MIFSVLLLVALVATVSFAQQYPQYPYVHNGQIPNFASMFSQFPQINSGGQFPQFPTNFGGQSDCDPNTVRDVIQNERKIRVEPAFLRGDADAVSLIFAPDVYFVNTGVPTMKTRQEVAGLLASMIRDRGVKNLSLNREYYLCFGPFAVEIGSFKLVNATGGEVGNGRDMVVWKKTNGFWYQQYSFNV